jgi:hypothetical protein
MPSYDSTDGFGRVESIKVYKNTSRKIDFSFTIAALGEEDFLFMWNKINKLTTLLYPQYSKGKSVASEASNPKYKITLPFSQMISASPMIRLRIGDVIQSNYSSFNLSRLFGYGTIGTAFTKDGKTTVLDNGDVDVDLKAEIDKKTIEAKTQPGNYKLTTTQVVSDSSQGIERVKIERGLLLKVAAAASTPDVVSCEIVLAAQDDDPTLTVEEINNANRQFANSDLPKTKIVGTKWLFNTSELQLTEESKKKVVAAAESSNSSRLSKLKDYSDAVQDFMDNSKDANKGNAVAKSFRTVGGRGLPGFIESMSFEWLEKSTWAGVGEQSPKGKRAPKMCEVNVTFSPVHDISPGIDHMGYNRAPIYPVGK